MSSLEGIVQQLLYKKLGEHLGTLQPLTKGANSHVYKVISEHSREYLVKNYLTRDTRDRLSTEFLGFSFLWENGIRIVPEPICMDKELQIGVYGYIKGRKLKPGEISVGDVRSAAEFIGLLHSLVNTAGAEKQPIASEACFTIKAYVDVVEGRLERLKVLNNNASVFCELRRYLENEFSPFLIEIKRFVKTEASRLSINMNEVLNRSKQTLSPSDFGFHNAIKCENGIFVFIDFEYYGWDDPAKMIADFYLQPAVPVPYEYRETFFKSVYKYFDKDLSLKTRLPIVYVILGLKWCLIMLNAFLRFPDGNGCDETFCLHQLETSQKKLLEIKNEFDKRAFPISLNRG